MHGKIEDFLNMDFVKGLFMEILGTLIDNTAPEAEILAELVIEGNWSFYGDTCKFSGPAKSACKIRVGNLPRCEDRAHRR